MSAGYPERLRRKLSATLRKQSTAPIRQRSFYHRRAQRVPTSVPAELRISLTDLAGGHVPILVPLYPLLHKQSQAVAFGHLCPIRTSADHISVAERIRWLARHSPSRPLAGMARHVGSGSTIQVQPDGRTPSPPCHASRPYRSHSVFPPTLLSVPCSAR